MKTQKKFDDTDYFAAKIHTQDISTRVNENRFVSIIERENRSDLPKKTIQNISLGKQLSSIIGWKGIQMLKDPFDIVLYQMLLWELKPRTIFEFGAYCGGSACWMGDLLNNYGIDGHIYSVDIDLSLLDEKAKHNKVSFIEGYCNAVEQLFSRDFLMTLPHPWLVIEDAHTNLVDLLDYFHENGIVSGDYVIVEDTNPIIPVTSGFSTKDDMGAEYGLDKMNEVNQFLHLHPDNYLVDTFYTDMFGYNTTWNWNAFLKRQENTNWKRGRYPF